MATLMVNLENHTEEECKRIEKILSESDHLILLGTNEALVTFDLNAPELQPLFNYFNLENAEAEPKLLLAAGQFLQFLCQSEVFFAKAFEIVTHLNTMDAGEQNA